MKIIPSINGSVREMSGFCTFPKQLTWEGPCEERSVEIFLARARRAAGLGRVSQSRAEEGFLVFRTDKKLEDEAYRLLVTEEGITAEASGQQGFRQALATLVQLLASEGPDLPCGLIEDHPRFAWRGFMQDVCRHFYDVNEIKKMIEQCSLLKLNRYHWHLSDDQGFRIQSERYPELNSVGSCRSETNGDGIPHGGFYTKDEIRDIVAYAAERGVEVVPEIDLPGHTTAILAAYPELSCTGEPTEVATHFGILERILCAGKEEVYTFLENLLDEVCELFPSRYFHIGGDEAPKGEWKKCPDCQRVIRENGLAGEEALQAFFTGRLVGILKKKGKTVIGWNEAMASGTLDPGVAAQFWMEMGPNTGYSFSEAQKGRKFIFSNMGTFYLDYPPAMCHMKAQSCFVPHVNGQPVDDGIVMGIEAPLWAEWLPTADDMELKAFPRLAAVAEGAWSANRDYDAFREALPGYLRQLDKAGIRHASFEEATVCGQEGIRQTLMHFAGMAARMGRSGKDTTDNIVPPEQKRGFLRMFLGTFLDGTYTEEEISGAVDTIISHMG